MFSFKNSKHRLQFPNHIQKLELVNFSMLFVCTLLIHSISSLPESVELSYRATMALKLTKVWFVVSIAVADTRLMLSVVFYLWHLVEKNTLHAKKIIPLLEGQWNFTAWVLMPDRVPACWQSQLREDSLPGTVSSFSGVGSMIYRQRKRLQEKSQHTILPNFPIKPSQEIEKLLVCKWNRQLLHLHSSMSL